MHPCLGYTSTSEYTLTEYTAWPFVSNREREREYKREREGERECVCTHLYPVSGKYDVFGLKSAVLISAEGSG